MAARSRKSSGEVTVFGELLVRLEAPGFQRFIQAENFIARYTGAEANAAVQLAAIGRPAAVVSAVPAHEIGHACVNTFRRFGVGTKHILRTGDRLGILYVENGASQRAGRVVYDRKGSSFSQLKPADLDWNEILKDTAWFHTSGITPALGEGPRRAQAEAIKAARRRGIPVSYDPNYRSTLWSLAEARRVLPKMIEGIDLFLGTPHDAELLFGIKEADPAASGEQLRRRFGLGRVAFTRREIPHASVNHLSALLIDKAGVHESRTYDIHIVDRIGSGDAFAAGMIHAALENWCGAHAIEFATACCALKQSIPGDFGLSTLEEISDLAASGQSGRVRR